MTITSEMTMTVITPEMIDQLAVLGACDPALAWLRAEPRQVSAVPASYAAWALYHALPDLVAAGLLGEIARLAPADSLCYALPDLVAAGLLGEIARLAPVAALELGGAHVGRVSDTENSQ